MKIRTGVLTNNPPFVQQMFPAEPLYMNLSPKQPQNNFCDTLGATGIQPWYGCNRPSGEILSSTSRFAKVAFTKLNSISDDSEEKSVSQFFHILGSQWPSRGVAVKWQKENMKLQSTPHAVMPIVEFTIILLMIIIQ